jgi:hypothetical protein
MWLRIMIKGKEISLQQYKWTLLRTLQYEVNQIIDKL